MKKIERIPLIHLMPFSEIDEKRSVLLVTSVPAWNAVKANLHLNIAAQEEPWLATTQHWDELLPPLPVQVEVIYAVGGGLVADAGKHLAARLKLPLVVLPTALSVDAFFTAATGICQGGCVRYIDAHPPDMVVIDFNILTAAPACLRACKIL